MSDNLKYICPVCGGDLTFSSEKQKMLCVYCDNEFSVDELSAKDYKLEEEREEKPIAQWEESDIEGMRIYHCSHCGASVEGAETIGAMTCPYCDTPMVIVDNMSGGRKPERIIPFKVDKGAAKGKLEDFCKGKKLLPDSFLANHRVESIKGMYVPFWLFDCETSSRFMFDCTTSSSHTSGDYRITETKHYDVKISGNIAFDNVPVDGSEKMDDTYMQSIEPFDYSEMVDFQSAYLAGYIADRYDVDDEKACIVADMRIKNSVEAEFKRAASKDHRYSTCSQKSKDISVNYVNKAEYAMLPVWIMTTVYNGKSYPFIMNGQTGKFVGKLPIDEGKKKKFFWRTTWITTLIGAVIGIVAYIM